MKNIIKLAVLFLAASLPLQAMDIVEDVPGNPVVLGAPQAITKKDVPALRKYCCRFGAGASFNLVAFAQACIEDLSAIFEDQDFSGQDDTFNILYKALDPKDLRELSAVDLFKRGFILIENAKDQLNAA